MGGLGRWSQAYFEGAPDGVIVVDRETHRILAANPRASEIIGRALAGFGTEELALDALVSRDGIGEHAFVRPDGRVIALESNARHVDGVVICCLRSLAPADASRRGVVESEARLRALFDSTQQVMILAGLDRRVQAFNTVAAKWASAVLGEPLEVGTRLDVLLAPVDIELFERSWARAIAGQRAFGVEGVPTPDGGTEWFESVYGPVTSGNEVVGVAITADRITERKLAEDALRESERTLELALDGADMGLWDSQVAAGTFHFNDRAASILGVPLDQVGTEAKWWLERIHPDDRVRATINYEAHLAGDAPRIDHELRLLTSSGGYRWFRSRGKVTERDEEGRPKRVSGTFVDVEEQKILEARLHQAERLESLGRLAGGVAHDFNNLLSVILGNLPAIRPTDPKQRLARDEIEQASLRAADLTRQLLAFGRRQPLKVEPIDPSEILRPMEGMLARLLPENIELRAEWRGRGWLVEADRVQLDQVLLNLVLNARDAMADGGVLRVRLVGSVLPAEVAERHGRPAGDYVLLEVSDGGVGMDPETQRRIFDPFFTTKAPGQGTGLGLATVYGVVSQHGGLIECDSAPGEGTTLRVYLPRAQPAAAASPSPSPAPARAEVAAGGGERLLVVEDDNAVRQVLSRILDAAGYEVHEASNAADALRALDDGRHFDMLITDVVMPGMKGTELAREVRRQNGSMRILVLSGYSEHQLDECHNVITKPFTPAEILGRVRQILDAPAGQRPA